MDAAILADFAARALADEPPGLAAELGCGDGMALGLLAAALPGWRWLGVEREPALAAAARMAIDGHPAADAAILEGDLGERACLARMRAWAEERGRSGLDAVVANPPYGLPGRGRPSPFPLRERARRGAPEDGDPVLLFCRAAACVLRRRGRFLCVFAASALPRLIAACAAGRLGLRRLVPVSIRAGDPARRVLIEARRDAADDLRLEPFLTAPGRETA